MQKEEKCCRKSFFDIFKKQKELNFVTEQLLPSPEVNHVVGSENSLEQFDKQRSVFLDEADEEARKETWT